MFKIKGGNSQLASRVLQVANATVHCPAAVAAVQRLADGRFQLELQKQAGHGCPAGDVQAGAGQCAESPSGATAPQPFDAVVVATPLEGSGLTFPGVHLPVIPARKFQQTVTTVIKGAVRPSYFGLSAMTYCELGLHHTPCHCCISAVPVVSLLVWGSHGGMHRSGEAAQPPLAPSALSSLIISPLVVAPAGLPTSHPEPSAALYCTCSRGDGDGGGRRALELAELAGPHRLRQRHAVEAVQQRAAAACVDRDDV